MTQQSNNAAGVIHVACAADKNFLPHCATMLHSLLTFHPHAQVHFLCGPDVDADTLRPLSNMVHEQGGGFVRHEISAEKIAGLPCLRQIPALMWYRIYLPELLPEQNKVLYLDADTLVVDDLSTLWSTSMHENSVAAVSNVLPTSALDWPQTLGMNNTRDYFNSGVLLLNLKRMRSQDTTTKLAAFGRDSSHILKWPDQDAFNALLWRHRRVLHPRYNCQNSLFFWPQSRKFFDAGKVDEAIANPAILHFEGGHLGKPWHYLNRHPLRHKYFEHRKLTPWPEVKLDGNRALFVFLRPLPTRWTVAILHAFYRLRARFR